MTPGVLHQQLAALPAPAELTVQVRSGTEQLGNAGHDQAGVSAAQGAQQQVTDSVQPVLPAHALEHGLGTAAPVAALEAVHVCDDV